MSGPPTLTAMLTSLTFWLEELQYAHDTGDWQAVAPLINNIQNVRDRLEEMIGRNGPHPP
jgi:hypothetical protein